MISQKNDILKDGRLFIVSGPSGVGKTSIVNCMLELDSSITRIITCTTREKRPQEIDGIDYFFMSKNEFISKIRNNEFLEFSEVYGNFYGVMFSTITDVINNGHDAVLVLNWEGFQKVKFIMQGRVVGFFINPPSMNELEARIKKRGSEADDVIQYRLKMASEDMQHSDIYDVLFVNHDVNKTSEAILNQINSIRHVS